MTAPTPGDDAVTPLPPPAEPDHLVLAGDFPPVDRERWRELARAVLVKSGAKADVDPELALTRISLDGIGVHPIYLAEDAPAVPPITRPPGAWDIRVRHDDPDPSQANAAVLADLEGGATSLWLRVGAGAIAPADLPRVLDGVFLDLAGLVLDAGTDDTAATLAAQVVLGADVALPEHASGSLGFDPIAAAFRRGTPVDAGAVSALAAVAQDAARFPMLRTCTVDGSAYHDAGAGDADEIAFATATAVAYLRELEPKLGTAGAFAALEFRFAVTDEQFPQLAKLRAARRIWARVAELAGLDPAAAAQRQHAVSSAAMMTVRDPWVNLLRTTVACFAAATGGADAITVLPFDVAVGRSDEHARRIARNTQAVLHDECSLARVIDPAAGSWYVESLTDELAHVAWERFSAIEREGGMTVAVDTGAAAKAAAVSRTERASRVAHRTRALTGISEFPNLAEERIERPPVPADASIHRWAEPFESLRDRSDEALTATGHRPQVTLLALGSRSAYAGRLGFATNLFHAGGFDTPVVTDPAAVEGGVVCLCSADKVYAEQASAAVAAIKAAGVRQVWLAGAPSNAVDGVDGYLYVGCDALDVLVRTWSVSEEVTA